MATTRSNDTNGKSSGSGVAYEVKANGAVPQLELDDVCANLLMDPAALEHGLKKHQAEAEEANRPLRQRLEIHRDLIATNRSQMERLLDLYLIGEIPRDLRTEHRTPVL